MNFNSKINNNTKFIFNSEKYLQSEKGLNTVDLITGGIYNNDNFSYTHEKEMLIQKITKIISILKNSLILNKTNQELIFKRYEELTNKQNLIEQTLEKIKNINKSKQKKHVKYLRYTPLSRVYYYSPKKNHYYYTLLDVVIKSRKKQKVKIMTALNKKDINRFKFTKTEDQSLNRLLNENKNYYEISQYIGKTPLQCFVRNMELTGFYSYKKWTLNEDNILKKAILYYGPKNWQQISYCLDGRNNSQCFHRWMKGINPKIKRTKWSFEEDLTLGIALKIYGNKKWSKIANHLNGRTDIQCRERFCNILDPTLEDVEWSNYEDIKLLSLYEKHGNKWSKIAREFGNRTDNTCWRRWKYLTSIRNFNSIEEVSEIDKRVVTSNHTIVSESDFSNTISSKKKRKIFLVNKIK